MDRRSAYRTVDSGPMQASEHPAFQLLLQRRARQAFRAAAYAPRRRDLHGAVISGFAKNCSGIEEGRLRRQSQACPADHAALGTSQQPARTQHLQATPGAHQISLPAGRRCVGGATDCLEHRYHVYPATKRVCVPRRCNRLVQPLGAILSSLKQLGDELLPGRSRRGNRTAREAQNLQYRPRRAIYLERVRPGGDWPRYSLQHGRSRSRFGQRVRGTAMEIGEV